MEKSNKKIKNSTQSLTGKSLQLYIEKKQNSTKITIENVQNSVYQKAVLLLVTVSFNLICLLCRFLSIFIVSALFFLTIYLLYDIVCTVRKESLLVIKGLGFQVSTKYVIGSKTLFIPYEQVQRIFINEVIYRHKVVFILTLLIKDIQHETALKPIFVDSLPRLQMIEHMYKSINSIH